MNLLHKLTNSALLQIESDNAPHVEVKTRNFNM